jgi:hypothetical protein
LAFYLHIQLGLNDIITLLLLGLGLLNYFGDSDEILIKVDYVTRFIFEGYDLIGKF